MIFNSQNSNKNTNLRESHKSSKNLLLKIGNKYSRKDVYSIFNVPKNQQKGNWNTGYTTFNNDIFIFANINSVGRTGHIYDNKFIGDELQWFGKKTHSLQSKSIQSMLDPKGNVYIFTRENSENTDFIYQGNARVKTYDNTTPVKIIWQFNDENEDHLNEITEEIDNPGKYKEGSTKQIYVNIYERNPIARRKCIEYYGCSCLVCGFNFENKYGELGKDSIHVHHIRELHTIDREYEVDPITDLRPVCPNCHAMLHKTKPAHSIEFLNLNALEFIKVLGILRHSSKFLFIQIKIIFDIHTAIYIYCYIINDYL